MPSRPSFSAITGPTLGTAVTSASSRYSPTGGEALVVSAFAVAADAFSGVVASLGLVVGLVLARPLGEGERAAGPPGARSPRLETETPPGCTVLGSRRGEGSSGEA